MRLLLDSSGGYLVCALADAAGVIVEERHPTGTALSRDIGAVAGRVLGELRAADLSAIVCGLGPGSFIGTRVAISFANGMAAAGGVELRGVPSLAAIAAVYGGGRTVVWRDARRAQVYWHGPGMEPADVGLVAVEELARRLTAQAIDQVVVEQPSPDDRGRQTLAELTAQIATAGASLVLAAGIPAEGLRRLGSTVPAVQYVEPVYLRGFL